MAQGTIEGEGRAMVKAESSGKRRWLYPEYAGAVDDLFSSASHEIAKIEEPILDQITWGEAGVSAGSAPVGRGVATPIVQVATSIPMKAADVIQTSLEGWSSAVYEHGRQSAAHFVKMVLDLLHQVTTKTGNIVQGKGPMTHDRMIEVMETMSFEVDEDLEPIGMTFLLDAKTMEEIESLPPRSPEQKARYRSLMLRRKEEQDAKRRTRRLD